MAAASNQVVVRARRILNAGIEAAVSRSGRQRIRSMAIHTRGYAEPGYRHADVIVTGNFNSIGRFEDIPVRWVEKDDTPKRVADLLGRAGVEVEWGDEWAACDWCHKLVRTEPDSHYWKPSFWRHPLGLYCHECVKSDPDAYLRSIEGRETVADTLGIELARLGYVCVLDDCIYGLQQGGTVQPKRIADALRIDGITRFVFRLDEVAPTSCTFSVFVHENQRALLNRASLGSSRS